MAVKDKNVASNPVEMKTETPAINKSPVEKPALGDGAYAIQVASFIVAEDADRLVARLREKGYPDPRREDENVSGHGMRYRVNDDIEVGFSIQFGSIYNNVVNNRFGGGGGGGFGFGGGGGGGGGGGR